MKYITNMLYTPLHFFMNEEFVNIKSIDNPIKTSSKKLVNGSGINN